MYRVDNYGPVNTYRDGPFRAILGHLGVTLVARDYCPDLLVRLETAPDCPRTDLTR